MHEQPNQEHAWLQKLVGEWTSEIECSMGPDQPPMQQKGRESIRSLNGMWVILQGKIDGEADVQSIMTLGYDPRLSRFVGNFIASTMAYLWPYLGSLDADRRILTLDSTGPSFSGDGSLSSYQDIIEFVSDDHRTLKSRQLLPNGNWAHFMTAHYHRVS